MRYRDAEEATRRRTFATQQEALDFHAAVRTDKARGQLMDDRLAKTLFRDVAERWFVGLPADRSAKTLAGYRSMLDTHVLPGLGHYPVGRITPSVLRTWLAGLPDISAIRKRHVFGVVVPILNLAVDDGMIRTSPAKAKTVRDALPKVHLREQRFLSADQVASLADAITPRYRTLVLFAAYTGMRAGEIAGLRVRNLDLMRGRATVKEAVSDVGGHLTLKAPKNGKTRTLALPKFLIPLLMEEAANKGPDAFVFGNGARPLRHGNFYVRHFQPACARVGFDGLRFHDLRHTAAALMIDAGIHPKAISDRLGHSSIAITMDRYGHRFPNQDDAIAQALDATYTGNRATATLG